QVHMPEAMMTTPEGVPPHPLVGIILAANGAGYFLNDPHLLDLKVGMEIGLRLVNLIPLGRYLATDLVKLQSVKPGRGQSTLHPKDAALQQSLRQLAGSSNLAPGSRHPFDLPPAANYRAVTHLLGLHLRSKDVGSLPPHNLGQHDAKDSGGPSDQKSE